MTEQTPLALLIRRHGIRSTEDCYTEWQGQEYLAVADPERGVFRILDSCHEASAVSIDEVDVLYHYSLLLCVHGLWTYGKYAIRENKLFTVNVTPYIVWVRMPEERKRLP